MKFLLGSLGRGVMRRAGSRYVAFAGNVLAVAKAVDTLLEAAFLAHLFLNSTLPFLLVFAQMCARTPKDHSTLVGSQHC